MSHRTIEVEFVVAEDEQSSTTSIVPSNRVGNKHVSGKALGGITLDEYLNASMDYAEWKTPFTERERVGVIFGCVGIVIVTLLMCFTGDINRASYTLTKSGFLLPGLNELFVFLVDSFRSLTPITLSGNIISGTLALALWQKTRLLSAIGAWHKVTFGIAVWGGFQILLWVMLPIAVVVLNFMTWAVVIVISVAIFIFVAFVLILMAGIANN
ncbi:MAG: hypothetical protein AAF702_28085 [Chloroflexota bacterium]